MRQQRRVLTSAAIDPGQLSGLELRLSGVSLTQADNTAISSWADTSGHSRTASQSNATQKPATTISGNAVVPNSPTGIYGAAFNFGENDNMTGTYTFDRTQGYTVYAWLNETVFGGNNQTVLCPDTSSPSVFFAGPTGKVGFVDADGTHESASGFAGASAFHFFCWVFYPPATGTGVAQVYHNDTVIQTTTWHATVNPVGYTVGNNQPLTSPLGGSLYEVDAFTGGHSEDIIRRVRAWGLGFWGM